MDTQRIADAARGLRHVFLEEAAEFMQAMNVEGSQLGEVTRLSYGLAELISFFVGVAVIGFYWTSHHWFFDDLEAVAAAISFYCIPPRR